MKISTANQPWTFSGFGTKPTSTCSKPTTSKLKLAQRQSPANIFSPQEQPTVYHYARVPNARQVLNLAVVHIFLFFQENSVSSKLVCTGGKPGTKTLALFTGFFILFFVLGINLPLLSLVHKFTYWNILTCMVRSPERHWHSAQVSHQRE